MRKSKKLIATFLAVVTIISVLSATAFAASWANAFDVPTESKYAMVYTLNTSGITIAYTTQELKYQGTINYGRSNSAYIDNSYDMIYLLDAGVTNGNAWAKVSYPVGSKYVQAYIYLSALSYASYGNNHLYYKSSLGKFYCSPRKGGSTSSYYYVDQNDPVYVFYVGSTSGTNVQIMYPTSNGMWRIAWCTYSDASRYLDGTGNSSGLVTSDKIKFNFRATSTCSTTDSSVGLTVNGTPITVGSTFYTYTYNGKYKTTSSYSGYTYAKVGSKYVDMNGWQCCAYARYNQYLLYGCHEYKNSKFAEVSGASYKTATASKMKEWIRTAGVGALICSTRPHYLIVIAYDDNGFYYTDANATGSANQICVGYYTWNDFANSKYRNIEYIGYYKG